MKIITRFPPSPTGNLHIGGARTALFNYLFTKKNGGKIHLRLENTDEERSKPEYEQSILDSLKWLGLQFDPIGDKTYWRQSDRKDVYRSYLKKLGDSGFAYVSNEEPTEGEAGEKRRASVIRFKNPDKEIKFNDLIRGEISFHTTELGDMVIAKSMEEPLYHLAVVIDDFEMGVTHVIRGEDHISNTPRQILLQEALGFPRPVYAHIPLILAPDRSKLSKRHGAVSVTEYRDRGYSPEAFLNYLALLGWNPGTEQEIFSLDELIKEFDIAKVHKGGAIFSEEKLRWMNKEYMKKAFKIEDVLTRLPENIARGMTQIQKETLAKSLFDRILVWSDIPALLSSEFAYIQSLPALDSNKITWKTQTATEARGHLAKIGEILSKLSENGFSKGAIEAEVKPYAEKMGKGNVLWPMRYSLSGAEKSPDPFTLASILGKGASLNRLKIAEDILAKRA